MLIMSEIVAPVIEKDMEEFAFLDVCPQVMMSHEDAHSVADTLNQLETIKS